MTATEMNHAGLWQDTHKVMRQVRRKGDLRAKADPTYTRTWMHSVLLPAQLGHTGSVFHDATVSPPRLVSLWLPCQTPLKNQHSPDLLPTSLRFNATVLFFKKSNLLPKDEDVWLLRKGHKNAQRSLPGIPNGELPKGHLCSFRRFYQKRFRTHRPVENSTVYCLPRFNKCNLCL